MNGYKIMADSYRKLAENGEIDKDLAEKECRIFDFLATCDDDDICRLFDSSAFNSIAKAYLKVAITELTDDGIINEDQAEKVRNRFSFLFEEKKAKDVVS